MYDMKVKRRITKRNAQCGINNLAIVGSGGFAKEVEWLVKRINQVRKSWNILGFIDKTEGAQEIIGDDSFILGSQERLAVAIGIGNAGIREALYTSYCQNPNIWFPNLIDPASIVSREICMGIGNIICANSVFTVNINLGNFNIINLSSTIGHDVQIGNYNTVNPGTNISGNVTIGNRTELGTGVKVIQGKNIGNDAIIGAGSVVISDVPEQCTMVGVPAKVIKQR